MNGQITVETLLAEEARILGERRLVLFGDAQPDVQLARVGLDEGGARFRKLASTLQKRGDVRDPSALAAWIGRKKYGKAKFQKMARHESSLLDRIAVGELFPEEDDAPRANEILAAFEAFLKVAESNHESYRAKLNPSGKPDKLGYSKGPKYWRIYVMSGGRDESKSAFGFFEPATGNLYKSEGWKKPAKGVRANVLDQKTWGRAQYAGIR